MINYFDWKSYLIDAKGCYDVIRKHGKDIVVMEPVKGGVLAQVPEATETWMRATKPELSPAGWALRFAASQPGVIAVLSGMSTCEQLHDNMTNMAAYEPLTVDEQAKLIELAAAQKAAGPAGTGDFTRYEDVTYHGLSVAAILDTYNAAMVQPNPLFSGEMNYLVWSSPPSSFWMRESAALIAGCASTSKPRWSACRPTMSTSTTCIAPARRPSKTWPRRWDASLTRA